MILSGAFHWIDISDIWQKFEWYMFWITSLSVFHKSQVDKVQWNVNACSGNRQDIFVFNMGLLRIWSHITNNIPVDDLWFEEPGHQQPWYWPSLSGIIEPYDMTSWGIVALYDIIGLGSTFLHIIACYLLPEPMLTQSSTYCNEIWFSIKDVSFKEMHLKMLSEKCKPFSSGFIVS